MGLNELANEIDKVAHFICIFINFKTSKHAIKLEETFFMINNKIIVYSILFL